MKNKIFLGIMLLVSVLLFLLKVTGLAAHIAVSVAGVLALVVFFILGKKEWKNPLPEILLRVLFAIAFISGIVIMKVSGVMALAILHKAAAALFAVLLLVLYIPKLIKKA